MHANCKENPTFFMRKSKRVFICRNLTFLESPLFTINNSRYRDLLSLMQKSNLSKRHFFPYHYPLGWISWICIIWPTFWPLVDKLINYFSRITFWLFPRSDEVYKSFAFLWGFHFMGFTGWCQMMIEEMKTSSYYLLQGCYKKGK